MICQSFEFKINFLEYRNHLLTVLYLIVSRVPKWLSRPVCLNIYFLMNEGPCFSFILLLSYPILSYPLQSTCLQFASRFMYHVNK